MKRFYFQFRVILMTFTLSFASVYFFNWFDNYWNEPRVDMPQVQSVSPIIISPKTKREMSESGISLGCCGGGGAGEFYKEKYTKSKTKNNKQR